MQAFVHGRESRAFEGWRKVCVLALVLCAFDAAAAFAQEITASPSTSSGCPPMGYPKKNALGQLVKQNQPALDYDANGNGKQDSWSGVLAVKELFAIIPGNPPIAVFVNWPAVDESANKNEVACPCIPDPKGLGCGDDYFSPRVLPNGKKPGLVVGKCHYACGRNTWKVTFKDANANGKPDEFLKCTWDCFDGGSKVVNAANFSPTAGDTTSYVTDIAKGKVEVTKIKAKAGIAPLVDLYEIKDSVIVDLGSDVANVVLDGTLLDDPNALFPGDFDGGQVLVDPRVNHRLAGTAVPALPGAALSATGTLRNIDVSSHSYQFALFGTNATLITTSSSLAVTLGPGDSTTYQLDGTVVGAGDAALVAYAYTSDPDGLDNATAAAIFSSPDMAITEFMAAGSGGEFVEFTNVGLEPVDMTGWSFDDDSAVPGTVDLSAFGVVQPGEPVLLTEPSAALFAADWGLSGANIIGGLTTQLDTDDQINLFAPGGTLIDGLSYGPGAFPGTVNTSGKSAWTCDDGVGDDTIGLWFLSFAGDSQGSLFALTGDFGNPGTFTPGCGWSDLGCALEGVNGQPKLVGSGSLVVGAFGSVSLTQAAPSAPALLLLSLGAMPVELKGGELKAFPILFDLLLATNPSGALVLPYAWPAAVPSGLDIVMQYLILDAAAPQGLAISNAAQAATP